MAPIFLTIRASDPIELSESQGVLLAYAVLGPLTLISALFLALRFVAIWYRKIILVADDGLLIASWVRLAISYGSLPTHIEIVY